MSIASLFVGHLYNTLSFSLQRLMCCHFFEVHC